MQTTKHNTLIFTLALLLAALLPVTLARAADDASRRAMVAVRQLTPAERQSLTSQASEGRIAALPRLKLPAIVVADGPTGVSGHGTSTQYCAMPNAAATWNRDLMGDVGTQLAADCLARGVRMLRGPESDAMTNALSGDNCLLLGEDSYLASELSQSLVDGLREHGVASATAGATAQSLLTAIYGAGLDKAVTAKYPRDNARSADVALREAEQSIVLLKNDGALLPLKGSVTTMALVGPFADAAATFGATDAVQPARHTTLRAGVTEVMPAVRLVDVETQQLTPFTYIYQSRGGRNPGLKAEYFNNTTLGGAPLYSETVSEVNFSWPGGSPNTDVLGTSHFSVRYTGYVRVPKSGDYRLALSGTDGYRLLIDDRPVIDAWTANDDRPAAKSVTLRSGRDYAVRIEYYDNDGRASLTFGQLPQGAATGSASKLSGCDVAVVAVGLGDQLERQGGERPWQLPAEQVSLIERVAAACSNTIVVIYSGGAVDVSSWQDKVRAIVWAGYPGQEGGTALARVMCGLASPSGRLPFSWPASQADFAAPDAQLTGYRHLDAQRLTPAYAFGHGLSYTTFDYRNLSAKLDKRAKTITATLTVANTGSRDGAEVVQAYVAPLKAAAGEPVMTLRGFEKVTLKKGQSKKVTLELDAAQYATKPGTYRVLVGASSRDLRQVATVRVK